MPALVFKHLSHTAPPLCGRKSTSGHPSSGPGTTPVASFYF